MEVEGLEFGDIRVDLRLQTVTRGGGPVALEPKTFEVLRYLLRHRDRLVTKEELLDSVWKDVFVTPNVLTRSIAQLRKALGDDAQQPRYIETVAKRGYRFVALVREPAAAGPTPQAGAVVASAPHPRARMTAWAIAVALGVAAASGWFGLSGRGTASDASPHTIERLTSSGDVIDAVISPDGNYVAYVRSSGGRQSLWVRQTSETNPLQLAPPSVVGYWGISFTPDSTAIYYAIKGMPPDADAAGTLYMVPVLPGPPPRRILSGIDSTVTFSPGGDRIAYYRVEPGAPGRSSLVIAGSDGSDARVIVTKQAPELFVPIFFAAPAWSPDGSRIAVAVQNDSTNVSEIRLVAVADGREVPLRQLGAVNFTAWLPDGSGVVFTGDVVKDWAQTGPQIWIQPIDGGEPRRVTTDTAEYRNVSLTSDGRALLSVGSDHQASLWHVPLGDEGAAAKISSMRGDGIGGVAAAADRLFVTGAESGAPQIWSMRPDGSERQQLTTEGWSGWPCLSPDGRTLYVVSYRGGRAGIWRMDLDGRNARELAAVTDAGPMRITPDGRWLYYTVEFGGGESTWRVSTSGGETQEIVKGLGRSAISPDGTRLAGMWRPSVEAPYVVTLFSIDGGEPLQQFPGFSATGGGEMIQWTRDGQSLLLTTTERMNIWRQPVSGGPLQRVTNFADDAIFGFTFDADGTGLILSKGPSVRDAFLRTGYR